MINAALNPAARMLRLITLGWFLALGGCATIKEQTPQASEGAPDPYVISLKRVDGIKAREFMVGNFESIRTDLQNGDGLYLFTLLETLKIKPEERADAIEKIDALSQTYDSDHEAFAAHVIALYQDRLALPEPIDLAETLPTPQETGADPEMHPGCPFQYVSGEPVEVTLKSGATIEGEINRCDSLLAVRTHRNLYLTYDVDDVESIDAGIKN